jgi:PqqD family protein of HPr-rel-A system
VSENLCLYRAEASDDLIIRPLDTMTLIYQRRSGITHLVSEPVPEILAAMGGEAMNAENLAAKLATQFNLGGETDAIATVADRLEELADLGLVERVTADA